MSGKAKEKVQPSLRALIVIGALAFALAAAVFAPASLIAPALARSGAAVSFERMEGRLWRGKISRLIVGEHYLGDVSFKVSPFQLLFGRLRARIEATGGDGAGDGVLIYSVFSQAVEVRNARAVFDLGTIRQYSIFGLPYQGNLRLTIDRLLWTKRGCRAAEADIWTDLLDASSRQLVGEGMELAGAATCDDARLALTLRGENAEGRTEVVVSLAPNMTYQLVASVAPTRPELQENLKRLGFEDKGASLVYDAMGAIKGLGS